MQSSVPTRAPTVKKPDERALPPVVRLSPMGRAAERIEANRIGVGVELFFVKAVDVADASEPGVQEAHVGVGEGGLDATAYVVAADYDVLYVEVGDGCGVC